jgi:hypothetical protein
MAFAVGAVAQAAHLLLRTVDDKRAPTQTRTHINHVHAHAHNQ